MRIIRLLLICSVTTVVAIGCIRKIEAPAATSGSQEIQETVEAYLVTVEEVKLDLTGVT